MNEILICSCGCKLWKVAGVVVVCNDCGKEVWLTVQIHDLNKSLEED